MYKLLWFYKNYTSIIVIFILLKNIQIFGIIMYVGIYLMYLKL